MRLKLYSTLDKKITQLQPLHEKRVGLYACGFTVYDYTHIGHLRKYTMDDVLIRALRYGNQNLAEKIGVDLQSYEVTFVQNVTDVGHLASDADTGEDKLEKGAKKYGKSVWDIAHEFEAYFFKSMDLMGNLRPDVSCRATEHIQEQLDMVIELERKGYTYIIEGDGVYFDTSKFPEYGKMAGLDVSQQEEGARIGLVDGKRNPADFALWKFERPGENRAMVWPSPWHERSFPGWHIECSAMAMKYLGEQFDIHTGGIDHIPVHHTNEIAQAEATTGKKPFVRYWVHHNHLHINGEKMSKSLGNFFTIDDVLERGFHPMALRLLFLTAHYRSEMNFTWENLEGAQKAYEKLLKAVSMLEENSVLISQLGESAVTHVTAFFESIRNDLNTAQAVSVVWSVIKDSSVEDAEKKTILLEFDKILGLGLSTARETLEEIGKAQVTQIEEIPEEISQKVGQRELARKNKDFATSDKIRNELLKLGWSVEDTSVGPVTVKIKRP
ncbi:MAG: cysteine--tRNA ligase [Patescibacteria group bacterium]|nr:MAG: cysteine--tRNA ligase [Patescibacteria group bacterium]